MKDFYIDFSEYPEAVASVLYEEVQKHAFELGCEWIVTKKTLERYNAKMPILIFEGIKMYSWLYTPKETENEMSVEEFLKMEKEPEYHVGMPLFNEGSGSIALYLDEGGDLPGCFTGVAIKHKCKDLQYISNGYYDAIYWKPIDPSRIKVTIK